MIESIALANLILAKMAQLPTSLRIARDARGTAIEQLLAWQELLIKGKQGNDKGYSVLRGRHHEIASMILWEWDIQNDDTVLRLFASISCALARLRRRLAAPREVLPLLVSIDNRSAMSGIREDIAALQEVKTLMTCAFQNDPSLECTCTRIKAKLAADAFERIVVSSLFHKFVKHEAS
jgi:hypothetical protein